MQKQDKATTERHTRILRELVKKPENKSCADCKRHDPRWASWNLGVFVCIRCSGIHRSMGTHISKVKSVDLDTWTPDQMASIQKWGNYRANLYWEAHLKPGHIPPDHKVESFIRSKYESRRWAMEGPPPSDPSVLEPGRQDEAQQEQPVVAERAQAQAQSPIQQPQSPVQQQQQKARTTAHPLLSTSLMSTNRAAASRSPPLPAAPTQAPPPPAPAPAPQDDLFSLDFNPAPASSQSPVTAQPKKDVKNDIMSLFGSSSASVQPAAAGNPWGGSAWGAPVAQQQAADPWAGFGTAAATAAPSTSSFFGGAQQTFAQPQQQTFPAQNVWASNGAATSQPAASADPWGAFGTATTTTTTSQPAAKKDDPFANLWG